MAPCMGGSWLLSAGISVRIWSNSNVVISVVIVKWPKLATSGHFSWSVRAVVVTICSRLLDIHFLSGGFRSWSKFILCTLFSSSGSTAYLRIG